MLSAEMIKRGPQFLDNMMFISMFIKPLLIISFSISVGKFLKVNGNNQRGEKIKNKISAPFMIYH